VGYWKLNEASGTQIFDASPYANHGSFTAFTPEETVAGSFWSTAVIPWVIPATSPLI